MLKVCSNAGDKDAAEDTPQKQRLVPAQAPAVSAWGRSSKLVFEPNPSAAVPDPSTTGPPGLSSTVSPSFDLPKTCPHPSSGVNNCDIAMRPGLPSAGVHFCGEVFLALKTLNKHSKSGLGVVCSGERWSGQEGGRRQEGCAERGALGGHGSGRRRAVQQRAPGCARPHAHAQRVLPAGARLSCRSMHSLLTLGVSSLVRDILLA